MLNLLQRPRGFSEDVKCRHSDKARGKDLRE